MADDSSRQAGARMLLDVEAMIAAWDREGADTYRELAHKLVARVLGLEVSADIGSEYDRFLGQRRNG